MGGKAGPIMGVGALAVLLLGGCSSGGGTTSASSAPPAPTATEASPMPTDSASPGKTFKAKVGDWELELSSATAPPTGWPSDIPAPDQGVIQATGTGEPIQTTSDHPIMAVEYMAPGEVGAVTKQQSTDMTTNGWEDYGTSRGITTFVKGNDSARISVKVNGSTGGVTVYQWT